MSHSKAQRGFSLAETLLYVFLMGLLLSSVAEVTSLGYRALSGASMRAQLFREASVSMDLMSRQLRQCTQVYTPDPSASPSLLGESMAFSPCAQPFVFRYTSTTGDQVAAYQIRQTETYPRALYDLESIQYDTDFDPAGAQKVVSTRVIAHQLDQFRIYRYGRDENYSNIPYLEVTTEVYCWPAAYPLQFEERPVMLGPKT
jgi:Tfp pilus assembly protein PilV